MYHTYKNAKVLIQGQEVVASDIQLSVAAQNTPVLLSEDRFPFHYSPTDGIRSSLNLSYSITGSDPLKDFIADEGASISGNIGGLYFSSGYLNRYSLQGNPNNPVTVEADIVFFEDLKGNFVPTHEPSLSKTVANYSSVSVTNLDGTETTVDELNTFSLDFQGQIIPVHYIDQDTGLTDVIPDRVAFGDKSLALTFRMSNLSGDMPISGKRGNAKIEIKDFDGNSLETFTIKGNMNQRQISTSVNQRVEQTVSIQQNYVGDPPNITGFTVSGAIGDTIDISGENFLNTFEVIFNDAPQDDVTVLSDILIQTVVPPDAITGPLTVRNFAGHDVSTTDFLVTQDPLTIFDVIPFVTGIDETITITGSNFRRVSNVDFFTGQGASKFSVIDPTLIQAVVPTGANYGEIIIESSGRGLFDLSPHKFVPNPDIIDFDPTSGITGTVIRIQGRALDHVHTITFNNIPADAVASGNDFIDVEVPSGNTEGRIRVTGESGTFDVSDLDFNPVVFHSAIVPATGDEGEDVTLFGDNFSESLMFEAGTPANHFVVSFNGATGAFERISFGQMDGVVPVGATTGPVNVLATDSTAYESDVIWTKRNIPPVINSIIPLTGEPLDPVTVVGSGFFGVLDVFFSGDADQLPSQVISGISGSDLIEDTLGLTLGFSIPATTLPQLPSGFYNIVVHTIVSGVTSAEQIHVTLPIQPGTGVSGEGNTSDLNFLDFGVFEVGSPQNLDQYVTGHNLSDFDLRVNMPGYNSGHWDTANQGAPLPIVIPARDSAEILLTIDETGEFHSEHVNLTGTWSTDDDKTGTFEITGRFVIN